MPYKNLNNLATESEAIIKANLLPRKQKPQPKKPIVEKLKEVVAPVLQPAPVVTVTTDSKDVIKAVESVAGKIKPLDVQPILNALYQVADAVEFNRTEIDLAPLISAVQAAKTTVDLQPVVDALQALKDDRVEERTTELADRIEKALSASLGTIRTTIVGGTNSGKVVNRNGVQVNPATEEKQDAIVSAVQGISGATPYATRLVTSGVYTYIGKADAGTAGSSATWQVQRLNETVGLVVEWADGNADFDNVWDNYASLSYS